MASEVKAGRELDRLVAEKVLGWRCDLWHHLNKGLQWCWLDANNNVIAFAGIKGDGVSENDALPHFSTNIADAWQIVEHLKNTLSWVSLWAEHDADYKCNAFDDNPDSVAGYRASANTAPLAICRCALLSYK